MASTQINQRPTQGALQISPSAGVSLRTPFTLTASGFSDPDAAAAPALQERALRFQFFFFRDGAALGSRPIGPPGALRWAF